MNGSRFGTHAASREATTACDFERLSPRLSRFRSSRGVVPSVTRLQPSFSWPPELGTHQPTSCGARLSSRLAVGDRDVCVFQQVANAPCQQLELLSIHVSLLGRQSRCTLCGPPVKSNRDGWFAMYCARFRHAPRGACGRQREAEQHDTSTSGSSAMSTCRLASAWQQLVDGVEQLLKVVQRGWVLRHLDCRGVLHHP